jgi:alpha-galactosidase
MYKVEAIDPKQATETESVSGAYLMHHGIDLKLRGDYDSTSVILEKLP